MVFFCRPGRMSRRAVLTGFLVGAGVVCAGVVCATADAASTNKAGITRVFIFLFSLCGRKHSAGGRVRATELRQKSSSCRQRPSCARLGRARRPSPHRQPCAILITCAGTVDTDILTGRGGGCAFFCLCPCVTLACAG